MDKLKVYSFDPDGETQGRDGFEHLLGNKGAKLCEMASLSLPVPEGLVISTEVFKECSDQTCNVKKTTYLLDLIDTEVLPRLQKIQDSHEEPVLFSVRSGAAVSMAGMMDTILNVGITRYIATGLANVNGYSHVLDCLVTYVRGIYSAPEVKNNERILDALSIIELEALNADDSERLTDISQPVAKDAVDRIFRLLETNKQDVSVRGQIFLAMLSVFNSWNSERAKLYRNLNGIPDNLGTAVIIQRMVYGNLNDKSGSGVVFSSCVANGDLGNEGNLADLGEYLPNVQGEAIVSGKSDPMSITNALESKMISKSVYRQLVDIARKLEDHFNDIQDIEFTVEDKRLYILQTRTAKRSGIAAVNYALNRIEAGTLDRDNLPDFINPKQLLETIQPTVDSKGSYPVMSGTVANVGLVSGVLCHTPTQLIAANNAGKDAIYLAYNTCTDDLEMISRAVGVVTLTGGFTCHAAVICRAMGKPCVVGVDWSETPFKYYGLSDVSNKGEMVLDATNGRVYLAGEVEVNEPSLTYANKLMNVLNIDPKENLNVINANDLDEDDLLELFTYQLDHGFVSVEYMVYNPMTTKHVFGSHVLPRKLTRLLDVMQKQYKAGRKNFTLLTNLNVSSHPASNADYLIRRPEKPSDYLRSTMVDGDDGTLSRVFGDIKSAKTYLEAVKASGQSVAEHYKPYVKPLNKLIKHLGG
ncbi:hypothetical protein 13VO501A_gene0086 [Vibrio phage 13VO501A]|nr:hypothetical protein 13VO501A_gene0086 [Vibrio phage 13VO501A]